MLVHEIDTSHCLNEEPKRFVLRQTFPFGNLQEEVTLWNILHHKVVVLSILEMAV